MEVEVVSYDSAANTYFLNPTSYKLWSELGRRCPPEDAKGRRREREALGREAELRALAYERHRVGEKYADRVVHVSLGDDGAGYDIESVTVVSEDEVLPRLIEVKAVSADSFRFFWTANEVTTARRFGSWYFLYLLPASAERFDIDGMKRISDPYRRVLQENERWTIESELLRCELKSADTGVSAAPTQEGEREA
jgi:hypothetical protein